MMNALSQQLHGGEMWGTGVNSQSNGVKSWSSINGVSDNSGFQGTPNGFSSWTSTHGNEINSLGNAFNSGFNSWGGIQSDGMAAIEMGMERMMKEDKKRNKDGSKGEKDDGNTLKEDSLAWLFILSSFRLLLFPFASSLVIDEYLEYNLDKLGVPDSQQLAISLASAGPITRYFFINSPEIQQRRQDLCTPPLDRGNGSQPVTRFYYDSANDQCKQFTYSGSGGNGNRFQQKLTCDTLCRPTSAEAEAQIKYIVLTSQISEVIDFVLEDNASLSYPTRMLVQVALVPFFTQLQKSVISPPSSTPTLVDASEFNG